MTETARPQRRKKAIIHTFEITAPITRDEYYFCRKLQYAIQRKEVPSIPGITEMHSNKHSSGYFHHLRINPSKLLGENDPLQLFHPKQINNLTLAFSETVREHYPQIVLPALPAWTANRIDFAVNVTTPYVKQYITLLQRSKRPLSMKPPKGEYLPGSVYLCGKATTINIYDKQDQMTKQAAYYSPQQIAAAANVLRCEVQCKHSRLVALSTRSDKRTTEFFGLALGNFITPELCRRIILAGYEKVACGGDYYTLAKATKLIKATPLAASAQTELINVLRAINKKRSIPKGIELYCGGGSYEYRIAQLEQMGINPVTLPKQMHLPKSRLANLSVYLHDQLIP